MKKRRRTFSSIYSNNNYFLTYFLRIVNEFARKRNIHDCSNRKRQDDPLNMGGGGKNARDSRNDCFRFRKRVRFKKNDSTNESIEWLKRDTSCSFQPVQKKQHGSGTGRHNGNKMARSTAPLFSFSILPYLLRRSRSTNFRALFLRLEKGRGGGKEKRKKKKEEKKKKEKCFEHGGKKILRLIESLSSFQNDNLWKTCNNTWQHFYYNTYSGLSIILDPGGKKTGGF